MKVKKSFKISAALALVFALNACDYLTETEAELASKPLAEWDIPADFNYATKRSVDFDILARDQIGTGLAGARIDVYRLDEENDERFLFSGITDSLGILQKRYPLPYAADRVVIRTHYIGLADEVILSVENDRVQLDFNELEFETGGDLAKATVSSDYRYLGDFSFWSGRPDYLEPEGDVIDADFLNDINASLPEMAPVPNYNPQYLAEGNQINTRLGTAADIWVTFVHEGAGYKNVLGFYSYPVDSPPQSIADIDSITIVFPNVSYRGSGGDLSSGDKVYLGFFPANTEIGWVLLADGWRYGVTDGVRRLFSEPDFNPENDPVKRQHNVLLYDAARDLTILGFEDLNREQNSDDDFNDALFYVTSNPRTAIVNDSVTTITYSGNDRDGDGVNDPVDDYPDDPERAFDNFYPAENTFGSLAFEDLWPYRGDYDFNDLVVDYSFVEIMNAQNEVVELEAEFVIKAVGASYENGFGFELGVAPELVAEITGSRLTGPIVDLAANGTENGQERAVAIVFDNAYAIINRPDGYYINTQSEAPFIQPDTIRLRATFTEPLDPVLVGAPPYNPFIFVNGDRLREVHLSGYAPTSLVADNAFFDSGDDNSTAAGYYRTANNLPWGLDIVETLAYPLERATIDQAHNHFVDWALTSGTTYEDWYKNRPGYRVWEYLYQQ